MRGSRKANAIALQAFSPPDWKHERTEKDARRKTRKGGTHKETGFVNGLLKILNSLQGVTVYRNNVGQYTTPRGAFIRYGVANPGGSDILGWRSVVITQAMVGTRIAQATGIECKVGDNKLTTPQVQFLQRLVEAGGLAFEARLEEGYAAVLERVKNPHAN